MKGFLYDCHPQWNSYSKIFILISCALSIFLELEIKKVSFYRQNSETFWHNIIYMVNSFVVSLYVTVMINILQKILEILHEKMLKAIDFYRFHNSALEKSNSLNGHSKRTLNKWIEVCYISCQVKSSWLLLLIPSTMTFFFIGISSIRRLKLFIS